MKQRRQDTPRFTEAVTPYCSLIGVRWGIGEAPIMAGSYAQPPSTGPSLNGTHRGAESIAPDDCYGRFCLWAAISPFVACWRVSSGVFEAPIPRALPFKPFKITVFDEAALWGNLANV